MKRPVFLALALIAAAAPLFAQDNIDEWHWPQVYQDGTYQIALYQPQLEEWKDFRHARIRAAVGIQPLSGGEATFGAIEATFDTVTDFEEKVVHFGRREVQSVRFPEAEDAAEEETLVKAVRGILKPDRPLSSGLETMVANVDRTAVAARETKVAAEVPPIHFRSSPALLVIFLGPPKFEPLPGVEGAAYAINTNWDLLRDGGETPTYYLLANDYWLTTTDIRKGPWTGVTELPAKFQGIPNDRDWSDVRARLEAQPPTGAAVPEIIVSERPAELILSEGPPQFVPLAGTELLYLGNSESDVFLDAQDKRYYFLTSGRWFSAPALKGPWETASGKLPAEFARIPEDSEMAHALVSVPGTAAAEEAVIMASIPQTATVNRAGTSITVSYDDAEPKWRAIGETGIEYALNTAYDVFRYKDRYYCCHQGVWFDSETPFGVWRVCAEVPDALYGIPADHLKHHVTYVQVYGADDETVQVGYTAGYDGAYIADGLLLFGLGYWAAMEDWEDDYWTWWYRYPPRAWYYGYGTGARWGAYYGGFYRTGYRHYGPYGGAGGGAIYNPWRGGFVRGGYRYGPRGAVVHRAAYSPWADAAASRTTATTPYGSWGRAAVVRDDEWARAAHRSSWRGSAGAAHGSGGNAAVRVDRRLGKDTTIVKHDGDVYVGRDGKIYKRDPDGNWSRRDRKSWTSIDPPKKVPHNWNPRTVRRDAKPTLPQANADAIASRRTQLETGVDMHGIKMAPTGSAAVQVFNQRASYAVPSRSAPQQLGWDSRARDRSSFHRNSPGRGSISRNPYREFNRPSTRLRDRPSSLPSSHRGRR